MGLRKAATSACPKKVASLVDLANLPSMLRDFAGQSQMSHLAYFICVWSYIKDHNLHVCLHPSLDPSRRIYWVLLLCSSWWFACSSLGLLGKPCD